MPDTTATRLAVLETQTAALEKRVKELDSLQVRMNVVIALASILGLCAGGLLFQIHRAWPYIPAGEMEVTIESKQFQKQTLRTYDNTMAGVTQDQPDNAHRWILRKAP